MEWGSSQANEGSEDRKKRQQGGGRKGGWIFLACGGGEGGIFSRGSFQSILRAVICKKTEGEQEACVH